MAGLRNYVAGLLAGTVLAFGSGMAFAEEKAAPAAPAASGTSTAITIYSKMQPGAVPPELYRPSVGGYDWNIGNMIQGYAMVRQERDITLTAERSEVKLDDISAFIDPTTVSFKSLTDPEHTTVLEQNYMFDLVNPQKLAERYLGQKISFEKRLVQDKAPEMQSGTLVSVQNGQMTVQKDDGSIVMIPPQDAVFPSLPGKLFIKPTLVWDVVTKKPGKQRIETGYQTEGITWWSDYNAVFEEGADANSGFLDIGAWVSIVNKSGASYENAKLKLVAGDVQRAQPPMSPRPMMMKAAMVNEMAADGAGAGFSEKAFFEFHLYTLGRPATIPQSSTKQIELFPKAVHIPVVKEMLYDGSQIPYYGGVNYSREFGEQQGNKKVDVFLKFKNDKTHGLGIPLPAGRLRVSKMDTADKSLEFIGEDVIDHTPKDEDIKIKLGEAFDVVGERKQTNFHVDEARRMVDESFEIKLRNHKDQPVNVRVKEHLYRADNWQISESSQEYAKDDANTVHYDVSVPKDGEKTVKYTVHYTW